jgi:hypothetical protein
MTMSDADLEVKFSVLTEAVILKEQTCRFMDACWNIEKLANAADIVKAGTKN